MREIEAAAYHYLLEVEDWKPRRIKDRTIIIQALYPYLAIIVISTNPYPREVVAAVVG